MILRVSKRSYLLLCASALTLFLSINCRYINKIRDTDSSVGDVEGAEQENQEQKESSVNSIASTEDEGTEGFIDINGTGYMDDGDDSTTTDGINVSNPPTKTVRSLSIMDLQVPYRGLFINRNHLHFGSAINNVQYPQDDDVKIESDEKRTTANNKRTRNSLPGDGDQCCATIMDLPEEYRGLFTSNTLHQLQDGSAINNAQHLQDDDVMTGSDERRTIANKNRERRNLPGDGDKCCATEIWHAYFQNLRNARGHFTVFHLSGANQLIPVARCVNNYGVCNGNFGRCVTVKEVRPVLVWIGEVNLDLNVTHQWLNQHVIYELFEIPHHCSCSNTHQW